MIDKDYGPFDRTTQFGERMRVEAHPGTDTWMRGDRYGTVEKISRDLVYVRMDRSGRTVRFSPQNIGAILDDPHWIEEILA